MAARFSSPNAAPTNRATTAILIVRSIAMATESFNASAQQLVLVTAPVAPDEKPVNVNVGVSIDRAARNAEAFDRVWTRMDRAYFAVPGAEGSGAPDGTR